MIDPTPPLMREAAREWLSNYHGSIDATALLLAFEAGFVKGAATALKERDFEWWEALALNDAVAPTPEAVKAWVIAERELVVEAAEERGAAREREECARLAQDAWCLMSTFSIEQSQHYAAACAEVAKIIRARAGGEK